MPSVFVGSVDPNCAVCTDLVEVRLPRVHVYAGTESLWFVQKRNDSEAFAGVDGRILSCHDH